MVLLDIIFSNTVLTYFKKIARGIWEIPEIIKNGLCNQIEVKSTLNRHSNNYDHNCLGKLIFFRFSIARPHLSLLSTALFDRNGVSPNYFGSIYVTCSILFLFTITVLSCSPIIWNIYGHILIIPYISYTRKSTKFNAYEFCQNMSSSGEYALFSCQLRLIW